MSLARNLNTYNRSMDGSAARALPEIDRGARPEARPAARPAKRNRKVVLPLIAGWLCVMFFSLALVHRNTQVLEETLRITQAREELALLERQNMEYETKLKESVSVEKVKEWALAHHMTQPVVMGKLNGDPAAVAVRPAPAPEPAPTVAAQAAPGFWGSLKSYFASIGGENRSAGGN